MSWLARVLLRLYPPAFRKELGDQLLADLQTRSGSVLRTRGPLRWSAWLLGTLASLLRHAIGEWREGLAPSKVGAVARRGADTLLQDLRFGARQLVRAPVLTIVCGGSIAVAVTAAGVAYSVFDALLAPLPVQEPHAIHHVLMRLGGAYLRHPYAHREAFAQSGAFAGLAAESRGQPVGLSLDRNIVTREHVSFVSPEYFDVLRVALFAGRAPGAGEGGLVVAHHFWRRQLAADSTALGATLEFNGIPLTIVGIAPRGFIGASTGRPVIGWTNVDLMPSLGAPATSSDFDLVGRLAAGVSAEEATERVRAVARALSAEDPDWARRNRLREFTVMSHRESVFPPGSRDELLGGIATSAVLVGLLLVLVCTNVMSLLLARALGRQHEISIRLALGATRTRLAAQLLTETTLLAIVGAALALVALNWCLGLIQRVPDFGFVDLRPNGRLVIVALVVSAIAALVSGSTPLLNGLRSDLRFRISEGAKGGGRSRLRAGLVGAQVGASCILVAVAVGAARGVTGHLRAEASLATSGLVGLRIEQPRALAADSDAFSAFVAELKDLVRSTPGVTAVAHTGRVPFGYSFSAYRLSAAVTELPERVDINPVDLEYFATVRARLLAGRLFESADLGNSAVPVVLVNRAFAESYPDLSLGAALEIVQGRAHQIVGVVEDLPYWSGARETNPLIYVPMAQAGFLGPNQARSIIAAVPAGSETTTAVELQRRIRERLSQVVPPTVMPIEQIAALGVDRVEAVSRVAFGLGALELLLAAVGLYGALLYAFAARRREVGVRLALGAAPRDAMWAVLRGGLLHALIGGSVGVFLAVPTLKITSLVLPIIRVADPVPFVAAAGAAIAAIAAASVSPALRVSRTDPVTALRDE